MRFGGVTMRRRAFIPFLAAVVLIGIAAVAGGAARAQADEAVDRLAVPGPIEFSGATYSLSWSSHPSPEYYKQEYLPAGEDADTFLHMVLIDAITRGTTVERAAAVQEDMLDKRKATDPYVHFAEFRNESTGEILLDFILSAKTAGGGLIVEWNAYRYAPLSGKDGETGVLLFGISRRAYDDGVTDFLSALKASRMEEITSLAKFTLPAVQPLE